MIRRRVVYMWPLCKALDVLRIPAFDDNVSFRSVSATPGRVRGWRELITVIVFWGGGPDSR